MAKTRLYRQRLPIPAVENHQPRACWQAARLEQALEVAQVLVVPLCSVLCYLSGLPCAFPRGPVAIANNDQGAGTQPGHAHEAVKHRLKHHRGWVAGHRARRDQDAHAPAATGAVGMARPVSLDDLPHARPLKLRLLRAESAVAGQVLVGPAKEATPRQHCATRRRNWAIQLHMPFLPAIEAFGLAASLPPTHPEAARAV
mmetsp:Transcript_50217/g.141179  ORF Transcript_50217/g.141179 Transcript_50217/m.141179 type:complete len:200 (-) Transcript_50217:3-602(-)